MKEISVEVPKGIGDLLASQVQRAASASISSTLSATKTYWEGFASSKLSSSLDSYVSGLNMPDSISMPDAFTGILKMKGSWPKMLESGFSAFDMKTGFSRSKKRHITGNNDWYMNIPFRHDPPQAKRGNPMPVDIYSYASALPLGGRLTGTEQDYPPDTSWTGYQHVNGLYEGITRVNPQESKGANYMTWRRVSNKSNPTMFWHPGFEGVHAMEKVEPFARTTFAQIYKMNIKRAMG